MGMSFLYSCRFFNDLASENLPGPVGVFNDFETKELLAS